MTSINLYETDFYKWTLDQAHYIKTKEFDKLDTEHLLEEIEDMGKHEKRELSSRLSILLMHLLKWQYQPTHRGVSWELTIKEQRLEVQDVLTDNPSLKSLIDSYINSAYQKAILKAAKETKLSIHAFPQTCEWAIEQLLDSEFYPN